MYRSRRIRIGSGIISIVFVAILIGITASECPAQQNTRLIFFDNNQLLMYSVQKNDSGDLLVLSSAVGVIDFTGSAAPGDQFVVKPDTNTNTQPPTPPFVLEAGQEGAGCLRVSWLQAGEPTVVSYVVSYGRSSVAGGGVASYEYKTSAGNTSSVDICQLQAGTWYCAVQARDYYGQLSAFSSESAVEITATAVLFTGFTARPRDHGVFLSWDLFTDEILRGFRLYRAETGNNDRQTTGYDELIFSESILGGESRYVEDHTVEPGAAYRYTILAVSETGNEAGFASATVVLPLSRVEMSQNVPNPFNPSTTIGYLLPSETPVRLEVFDVRGRSVVTLHNKITPAGRHKTRWNGEDRYGNPVSSGFYYYRLTAGKKTLQRKMLLLK
jgi:hypothetical protein